MSRNVGSEISKSGMVENVGVAIEVSFVVVIHAQVSCIYSDISKYFRFSGRHIGFLECANYGLKAPPCSQFIFRKSRQGASFNSKRFGNGSQNSGLGLVSPPLTIQGLMKCVSFEQTYNR